ncbi:MAG: enolase C-terminal domain-like protein, partial [Planctomycetota bacterium]
ASATAPLGWSAAVACAGAPNGKANVKIDRVEVFPVRSPTVGYFKFFKGPQGEYGRAAVIVKMTADDGTVGWGQSVPIHTWSHETLETATVVIRDYLAPTLVGHDPCDIPGAHRAMDRGLAPSFTTAMPIARAGLDLALHDLAGKLAGRSLAEMWGKPRGGPLTLSWTLNPRTLDEVDPLVDAGRKRGYRHFNIKVAPDPKFDVELARRVRRLVPNGFLWADANGGYDVDTALAVAPKLAEAGVDVLEAPLKPNRIRGYQALKKQGALPILMDEGVVSPVELAEFIRLKMLDGLAMKASRTGGLFAAKRQIEILLDAGLVWLGSGLCDPDISLAANLGLYGAFALDKPAALNGPQFLAADVLREPLKITDGTAQVPAGPGLGVRVDEAKVRELVEKTNAHAQG